MITFSQIGSYGRLGNQLFQYAALKSLSYEKGYKTVIPILKNKKWHEQECELNNFCIDDEQNDIICETQKHEEQIYTNKFFQYPDNINLNGFFQDIRYFEKHLSKIKENLQIKQEIKKNISFEFSKFQHKRKNSKVVSIHVRLGDLFENDFYDTSFLTKQYVKYYNQAIDIFGNQYDFLIFTGGTRCKQGQNNNDLIKCKKLFKRSENLIFSENNSTFIDFGLKLMCDHHIISPLSTYSLWTGYLSDTKNDKKIISPKDFYLKTEKRNNHLYQKEWIAI